MQGQINDHSRELEALREEILTQNAKIEYAENRSRRVNLQIRGIPETITDVMAKSLVIFKNWDQIYILRGWKSRTRFVH